MGFETQSDESTKSQPEEGTGSPSAVLPDPKRQRLYDDGELRLKRSFEGRRGGLVLQKA